MKPMVCGAYDSILRVLRSEQPVLKGNKNMQKARKVASTQHISLNRYQLVFRSSQHYVRSRSHCKVRKINQGKTIRTSRFVRENKVDETKTVFRFGHNIFKVLSSFSVSVTFVDTSIVINLSAVLISLSTYYIIFVSELLKSAAYLLLLCICACACD